MKTDETRSVRINTERLSAIHGHRMRVTLDRGMPQREKELRLRGLTPEMRKRYALDRNLAQPNFYG